MKLELDHEMYRFFLLTMEAKKKRLLLSEPKKVFSPYETVGMITVKWCEGTEKEKEEHADRRAEWELKMNRTEKAIDMLEELKETK